MVTAEDAVAIYHRLLAQEIPIWLTGGWGIDALLGEQTRPHKDLDFVMLLDDVRWMCELFAQDGYRLKELWSENAWAVDSAQNKVPTAFVLHDSAGRELDVHALCMDEGGNGIPEWAEAEDFIFSKSDLGATGVISGVTVPCISAAMQMRSHTGYTLPDSQRFDLEQLHKRFGVEYP